MKSITPIPYAHQTISWEDLEAVQSVLHSDWLTQGPKIAEFEEAVADFCGARYAVSFSNGTAALHAAMVALGVGPNDEGIVPAITFAATANCLLYTGATPRFADVTSHIPQINQDVIKNALSPKTKVILPVHFAGDVAPVKMLHNQELYAGIPIVEDACHAFGSSFYDEATQKYHRVGCCLYSQMTVFSFHPVKNITTGEGGMVTTNDSQLADKLRKFRHHGICPPRDGAPVWDYSIDELGTNYRLTDMQAAIGCTQIKRVDHFRDVKIGLIGRYLEAFKGLEGLKLLIPNDLINRHLHLAIVQVANPKHRDPLFNYLRKNGILAQLHYKPLYRHPLYAKITQQTADQFPGAEDYFQRSLSLPLYPDLTWEQQDYTIDIIKEFFQNPEAHS